MLRGSCLCGMVRYEINGTPQSMYYCHCGMCRKATGSSFATNMLVRTDDLKVISGEELLKGFESSPNEFRYFCSECGSPVLNRAAGRKGTISVRCGTLDTNPGVRPAVHTFTASKAPWFEITDGLPQLPEAP